MDKHLRRLLWLSSCIFNCMGIVLLTMAHLRPVLDQALHDVILQMSHDIQAQVFPPPPVRAAALLCRLQHHHRLQQDHSLPAPYLLSKTAPSRNLLKPGTYLHNSKCAPIHRAAEVVPSIPCCKAGEVLSSPVAAGQRSQRCLT